MTGRAYYRPIVERGRAIPAGALMLAGGACWFERIERLGRDCAPETVTIAEVPEDILRALTSARAPVCGMSLDRMRIMGIVNVTPDSFSDGGRFETTDTAIAHGEALIAAGADILDIGGESTRPGSAAVSAGDEIERVAPVIAALSSRAPVSIDTRKAAVARAAVDAGSGLINDVSGFGYDPQLATTIGELGAAVCVMHTQGTPDVMQKNPHYGDVLLDVYDVLADLVAEAEAAGIPRERIVVDPGIGFGKNIEHNLTLLRDISLFHSLGCAILVGASRKQFIGKLTGAGTAAERVAGSVAVAQAMASQGVQVIRVHDVAETRQALIIDAAIAAGHPATI